MQITLPLRLNSAIIYYTILHHMHQTDELIKYCIRTLYTIIIYSLLLSRRTLKRQLKEDLRTPATYTEETVQGIATRGQHTSFITTRGRDTTTVQHTSFIIRGRDTSFTTVDVPATLYFFRLGCSVRGGGWGLISHQDE